MSTSANFEPRVLHCAHCQKRIDRDPSKILFVVALAPASLCTLATMLSSDGNVPPGTQLPVASYPMAPFTLSVQRADFLVADEELAFGSMICIKKWLLDWVNTAFALSVKAGRA